MATAPNTGSTIALPSGINKTSTSISTNILITVNGTPVGAVKTLTMGESRTIAMIREIGTDGTIDSVPQRSTDYTVSCTRTRFDRLRIAEAFSRGFIHASAQAYPFDIYILDRQKRDQGNQITTVLKNCWINRLDVTYSSDDWVISETMGLNVERIFSVLGKGSSNAFSGGNPVAQGGELGIKHMGAGANGLGIMYNNIEQLSDTGSGGRGGSLDASGLIDLGSNGELLF